MEMDGLKRSILWVALLPEVEGPVLAGMTRVLSLLKESDELFKLGRLKRADAIQAASALEQSIQANKKWTHEDIGLARKLASAGDTEG